MKELQGMTESEIVADYSRLVSKYGHGMVDWYLNILRGKVKLDPRDAIYGQG